MNARAIPSAVIAGALALALAAAPVTAQGLLRSAPSGAAVGTVVTPHDEPLEGVPLEVAGPMGYTTIFTGEDGRWNLYNLPSGTYSVKVVGAPDDEKQEFTVESPSFWDRVRQSPSRTVTVDPIEVAPDALPEQMQRGVRTRAPLPQR